jgi:hypothetical protein
VSISCGNTMNPTMKSAMTAQVQPPLRRLADLIWKAAAGDPTDRRGAARTGTTDGKLGVAAGATRTAPGSPTRVPPGDAIGASTFGPEPAQLGTRAALKFSRDWM